MVWMHGGGFTNGSSMESYAYDGRTLSEFGDVVVVSVNHRLNILGTLDLSAYGPQYANSRYTGHGRPGGGAAVGARQHRELRRRSRQRDDLRPVRRRRQSRPHDAHAGREGPVPQGRGAERRQQHLPHDRSAASIKAQQTIAAHTLKNLNLTGDQIDKLKTVPYPALITAGAAALRSAAPGTRAGRRSTGRSSPTTST